MGYRKTLLGRIDLRAFREKPRAVNELSKMRVPHSAECGKSVAPLTSAPHLYRAFTSANCCLFLVSSYDNPME